MLSTSDSCFFPISLLVTRLRYAEARYFVELLLKCGQAYKEAKDLKEEVARLEKEMGVLRQQASDQRNLQADVEKLHRDQEKLRQGEAATAAAAAEMERLKNANELLLKTVQAQLQHGTEDGAATPGFCGWLTKQGSGGGLLGKKNWKTRWVIIKNGWLTYHKTDALRPDSSHAVVVGSALGGKTGQMMLSDCTVMNVKSDVLAGTSSGFLLRSDQKELLLQQCHEPARAAASYDRKRWIAEMVAQGCNLG